MRWARLPALLLCIGVAGGCGAAGDSTAAGPAAADCDRGGPVVALNRNDAGTEGLAEVVVADRGGQVTLVSGDWVATRPSFSPDGRRLVVVRATGDYESAGPGATALWTVGSDGRGSRPLTEGRTDTFDDYPAWSPDGSTIAFSRSAPAAGGRTTRLMTMPASGGPARALVPNGGAEDMAPAWSPDGRTLAFIRRVPAPDGGRRTSVWVVDAAGRHARQVAQVADALSVRWHPQRNLLLVSSFAREDGTVSLVDAGTGRVRPAAAHATLAAWAPGGDVYYYARDAAAPSWRVAEGHVAGDQLARDRYVGPAADYVYDYFGLAVRPCT